MHVGRPDAVHDVNGEAVRVERAACGEDHRRCRSSAEQQHERQRQPLQQPQRVQQRREAVAMGNDPGAGGHGRDPPIDVGKAGHHACAVDAAGKVVFSQKLVNGQAAIEELIARGA